ncbi:hypothetical protein MMC25_007761 [Agyrium rufum]|nr:hypothetical protein [Agyrium rufum]
MFEKDFLEIASQLGAGTSYDAISWVWGPPSEECTIQLSSLNMKLVDEKPDFDYQSYRNGYVTIRPSLHEFLLEMRRRKHNRFMWIDALGIDQDDPEDKNRHIPIMKSLYEEADHVHVWLGSGDTQGRDVLQQLPDLTVKLNACADSGIDLWRGSDWAEVGLPPQESPIWVALRTILTHPWWSRLWTLQEVVITKSGEFEPKPNKPPITIRYVLYGDLTIPWATLGSFARAARRCILEDWMISGNQYISVDDKQFFDCIDEVHTCKGSDAYDSWGLRPSALFLGSRRRLATVPADMVIGISGMLDQSSIRELNLDSTEPTAKIFLSFGQYYIRQEPIECLLNHTAVRQRNPDLPSWCPNFASKEETLSIGSRWFGNYEPSDAQEQQMYHAGFNQAALSSYRIPHSRSYLGKMLKNVLSGRTINKDYYATKHPRQIQLVPDSPFIRLSGVELDEVTGVIDYNPAADSNQFLSLSSIQQTSAWDAACLALAIRTIAPRIESDSMFNGFETYARTITANRVLIKPATDTDLVFDPDNTLSFSEAYLGLKRFFAAAQSLNEALDEANMAANAVMFARVLHAISRRRKFFATKGGRIGMGPSGTQRGDRVIIAFFCPTPYLLRKTENRYTLVGETYVDGIMYGEALRMLDRKEVFETKWIIE